MTVREYFARAKTRKAARVAKAATLWAPKAPRKPRWSPGKRLEKQLDDLCALYVKMRDRVLGAGLCRICGRSPIAVAYHILQRGYRSIRWDLENVVGACSGCNWWEKKTRDQNPAAVRARHVEVFGEERIARLESKKNSRTPVDKRALKEVVEQKIRTFSTEKGV